MDKNVYLFDKKFTWIENEGAIFISKKLFNATKSSYKILYFLFSNLKDFSGNDNQKQKEFN